MEKLKYCGDVAIIGHPNVGKSSLLNAILGRKTAIVCNKPQTTRDQVKAVYDSEEMQIVFIDTPGYHLPRNELDNHLNAQARHCLKGANVVLFVVDPTSGFTNEDSLLVEKLVEYKVKNAILVINKIDLSRANQIENVKRKAMEAFKFNQVCEICANDPLTFGELFAEIKKYLVYTTPEYSDGDELDLFSDDFRISEIVREKCLQCLDKEIPYGIAVYVDDKKYYPEDNRLIIDITIVCERESQKKIVIGTNGSMIRKIGTEARKELLEIYDCSIILRSFVKVDQKWRNSKSGIEKYGYGK